MKTPRPTARRRGFSLAEVIVASGVNLIVVTLALLATVAIVKIYYRTETRETVNSDYRSLVQKLETIGRGANSFYIYDAIGGGTPVGAGASGDMVVFVYYSVNQARSAIESQGVSRVVGIYRENSGSELGAIRWFDSANASQPDWPNRPSQASPTLLTAATTIDKLLPPASMATRFPKMADMTLGTAAGGSTSNPNTFYNDGNIAVVVSGLIYKRHSGSTDKTTNAQDFETRNAFNLTLSPRS